MPITVAAITGDNLSAGASVKVQSSATSIVAALTAPSQTQTLVDNGTCWRAYFASQSHRYVVVVFTDPGNTAGYVEAAIVHVGTYRQPSVAYSTEFAEEGDDLSFVGRATEGANLGDLRPEARAWQLKWEDLSDSSGDPAMFRAIRTATPPWKNWFLDFDPSTTGAMVYGFRDSSLPMTMTPAAAWSPSFVFREALP